MTVNQEQLIKEVAEVEGVEVSAVREIVKTMGDIIFEYLSSATPSEQIIVKPWIGLYLRSEFIPAHTMEYGVREGVHCPDKIRVGASFSRTYKEKINGEEKEDFE